MQADRRGAYLDAMGVTRWRRREEPADDMPSGVVGSPQRTRTPEPPPDVAPQQSGSVEPPSPAAAPAQTGDVAGLDWEALQRRVAECTACELSKTRTHTVFGVGDPHADLMVIGEAPGADEDRQGEPFVGRAGQLLNEMLLAIGLRREQVFIANILKCRPPGNRDPRPEEVERCMPYLLRQIALIQPRVLLSVGRISAQNLLQTDTPVGRLRGRVHRFGESGIPLVVTYHPAYLLRSPEQKAKAWADLQLALRTLRDA